MKSPYKGGGYTYGGKFAEASEEKRKGARNSKVPCPYPIQDQQPLLERGAGVRCRGSGILTDHNGLIGEEVAHAGGVNRDRAGQELIRSGGLSIGEDVARFAGRRSRRDLQCRVDQACRSRHRNRSARAVACRAGVGQRLQVR